MSTVTTDIRCPTGATSLMGKLVYPTGEVPEILGDVLLEYHCKECTKDFRRLQEPDVILRVLHLYHLNGDFHSTKIQFRDGAERGISLKTQVDIFKLSTEFRRGR